MVMLSQDYTNINGIFDGKMALMNTTVELDKAGRIVIPKKVRDAIGMRAGDKLDIDVRGEEVVLRSERHGKGLYKDRGLWVYDSGAATAPDTVAMIRDDRERRMRYLSGESLER
jgi:AbrB family looped-hinge helix DNA binding protein